MSSPCQDCPHRKLKCHDRCDEYIEWHDARVEARDKLTAARRAIDYLIDMTEKRRKKAGVRK